MVLFCIILAVLQKVAEYETKKALCNHLMKTLKADTLLKKTLEN